VYSIGDYVVKSNEGVCRIEERVRMKSFDQVERPYFLLVPVSDPRAKLYIPDTEEYRDVRPVMTKEEALLLISRVNEIACTQIDNDKLREKTYKEALHSNNPEKLVGIIKSLFLRGEERKGAGKKVTVVDDRCFKAAENALYSELSFVLEKEVGQVRQMIMETASSR